MTESLRKAAGWYGKLPSRGDFVGRGLPRGFLLAWDDGWQQALAEVASRHGPAEAKERLRGMGVQRFQARLAGEPLLWAGVVMPSQDRVGRCYPLTVAEAWEPAVGVDAGLPDRVERLASQCLELLQRNPMPQHLDELLESAGAQPLIGAGRGEPSLDALDGPEGGDGAAPHLQARFWAESHHLAADLAWRPLREATARVLGSARV